MMKLKALFVLSLSLLVTSCSYIYGNNGIIVNRNKDYLKAKSIQPVKIPPGISSSTMKNEYPISYKNYPRSEMTPSLKPPYLN